MTISEQNIQQRKYLSYNPNWYFDDYQVTTYCIYLIDVSYVNVNIFDTINLERAPSIRHK